jgi:hypothetical protein
MTVTFRSLARPTHAGDDRTVRLKRWSATVRTALRAVFTTLDAEEQYLGQATDLHDLELRLRCTERGQAPYQQALKFTTYG